MNWERLGIGLTQRLTSSSEEARVLRKKGVKDDHFLWFS